MALSFEYDLTYPGPAFPIVQVAITGRNDRTVTQTACLDTGADATVIPIAILRQINARRLDQAYARNMDGSRYAITPLFCQAGNWGLSNFRHRGYR